MYERGHTITPQQLMATMEQYWEVLVQKGEWDTPSDEEQQLMVMKAELKEMQSIARKVSDGKRHRTTSIEATMACMVTIVMKPRATSTADTDTRFDTDSMRIGVNNQCTACILDNPAHFVGELTPGLKVIKGFRGSRTTSIMTGTMR
jgi:hypothetical protein